MRANRECDPDGQLVRVKRTSPSRVEFYHRVTVPNAGNDFEVFGLTQEEATLAFGATAGSVLQRKKANSGLRFKNEADGAATGAQGKLDDIVGFVSISTAEKLKRKNLTLEPEKMVLTNF